MRTRLALLFVALATACPLLAGAQLSRVVGQGATGTAPTPGPTGVGTLIGPACSATSCSGKRLYVNNATTNLCVYYIGTSATQSSAGPNGGAASSVTLIGNTTGMSYVDERLTQGVDLYIVGGSVSANCIYRLY